MVIHLIRFPVPKQRRRTCRFPKRTVKRGCKLHGIGHDRRFFISMSIQLISDGSNPPVHHVRRRYHVRPCLHLRKRRLCQQFQCLVIVEYAMAKAAAQAGWIDEAGVMCEMAVSAFRAGTDIYITYFARRASYGAKRPHRRIHSSWNMLYRFLK